ncbi:glycosyltransferase family 2 protein [Flavobacterium sp. LC2016-12]|uniref:glycosyltransferase family 2 protein n=1 Tax=Flavobacterium sp. LC2016-12 TaxID=2783794 RepID=UPI00188A75DA|nr:glycosyltransferase family 2 protein [Flavobacterium sp. LC2016-12]MBF4465674.1 glycosyltransferase family 2 protein [Flavobacterium sp. LC2016-12]
MSTNLAPIVLFVFNRPQHTEKTLQALAKNTLAADSILYIYCDGVSDNASQELRSNNDLVKKIIKQQKWCKEVVIIASEKNKGLANSVISGVTEIVNKYGKVIVLEDDLITASTFLEFMNEALDRYEKETEVIQISGYSFPAPKIESSNSSYFLTLTSTWGWATWKRAWDTIDFECSDYVILKKNKKLAHRFNYNGSYNYKKMFLQQMESNKISSWGIRFYWNAFKKNALILFPDKSLVFNNGWDSSGKHKDSYDIFPMPEWQPDYKIEKFPTEIKINNSIETIIGHYLKNRTSFAIKVYYKLKLIFFKK